MRLFDTFVHATLPTPHNSYRPLLLHKSALALFLAVVLAAEGLFVASLYQQNPSQMFLAAVANAPETTASSPLGGAQESLRAFARAASDPRQAASWALGGVALVLGVLLVAAVVMHARVQPHDLILPGTMVVVLTLFFLWCNAAYTVPPPGDNALAAPGPAQYHW